MVSVNKILVTGGNTGIGFAICKQLAVDRNCHVFLTARTPAKGEAAVAEIQKLGGSVEFVPLDVTKDESVLAAAETIKSKLQTDSSSLYGVVNNAGIGLNTGYGDIMDTNLFGTKRVCEAFLDMIDQEKGRIVNFGSGSGPMYVSGCSREDQKVLCEPSTVTWEWIENHSKGSGDYGKSKALLACYTGFFAREHPNILSSAVSPGFINTQMTEGWGATKSPDEATVSVMKCLFDELKGNGYYYGSDGLRSPYHFMRNPGEPEYDGVNPFN